MAGCKSVCATSRSQSWSASVWPRFSTASSRPCAAEGLEAQASMPNRADLVEEPVPRAIPEMGQPRHLSLLPRIKRDAGNALTANIAALPAQGGLRARFLL